MQHLPEGMEFDKIMQKRGQLDLGEFLIFCKDFNITLNKKKIIKVFKKTGNMSQTPINFEQFEEALGKIAVEINQERIVELKKRLKELKKIQAAEKAKRKADGKTSESEEEEDSDTESKKSKTNQETPENAKTENNELGSGPDNDESESKTGK